MHTRHALNARAASFLFCASTLVASAQDYSHFTVIDGRTAHAAALAIAQAFSGRLPDAEALRRTTVTVVQPGEAFTVTVSTPIGSTSRVTSFTVDTASGRVTEASGNSSAHGAVALSGTVAGALTLSDPAFSASTSPQKPKGDIDVQINTPYSNLPNLIYVAYLPKGYKAAAATVLPAHGGMVTIGCSRIVSFSVDLSTHVVTPLKPVC